MLLVFLNFPILKNIIITGPQGSGKTRLANIMKHLAEGNYNYNIFDEVTETRQIRDTRNCKYIYCVQTSVKLPLHADKKFIVVRLK